MGKILIVEDEPLLADLYKMAFNKRNHEVELAFDGREGLEKVQAEKPSIILLDVMMPNMNGLQVLQHLKNNEETKDIPVIILTNLTEGKVEQELQEIGASMVIVKSQYLPNQIVDMVEKRLSSGS